MDVNGEIVHEGSHTNSIVEDSDKDIFADIHELILNSCSRLALMEQLEGKEEMIDSIESEDQEMFADEIPQTSNDKGSCKDLVCDASDKVDQKSLSLKRSFVHNLLIKKHGIYHCSECIFSTARYKSFHSHCKRIHSKTSEPDENSSIVMYDCTQCVFATFTLNGFKIHCSSKHKKLPYKDLINFTYLPSSEAHDKFKQYIGTISENKHKRQVLQQYQNYFVEFQKPDRVSVMKKKKKNSKKKMLEFNGPMTSIPCMMCDYSTLYPDNLESHYADAHKTSGPSRNTCDHMYHCEKCLYRSVSYKELHSHYENLHEPLEAFTPELSDNVTILESYDNSSEQEDVTTKHERALEVANGSFPGATEKVCENNVSDDEVSVLLKCDLCRFQTSGICEILNHWKTSHNRIYPPFVMDYINKSFEENIIEVRIPLSMVSKTWINGWMNEDCSSLIKSPMFKCSLCNFNSPLVKSVSSHYSTKHDDPSCLSKVDVFESSVNPSTSTRRLCKQNMVYNCSLCTNFTSCFSKSMTMHFKIEHQSEIEGLSEIELENKVRGLLVNFCVKCQSVLPTTKLSITHYQVEHRSFLPTFSVTFDAATDSDSYKCLFCGGKYVDLGELSRHLEMHRFRQLNNYEKRHISAYCCSKCRRVFRVGRFIRHHLSRIHIEWSETSFKYSDFPSKFICKKRGICRTDKCQEPPVQVVDVESVPDVSPKRHLFSSSSNKSSINVSDNPTETAITADSLTASEIQSEYTCNVCSFSTSKLLMLRSHMRGSHGRRYSVKELESFRAPGESMKEERASSEARQIYHTCSHNTWIGKSPFVYQKHIHTCHNLKQPYNCPYCLNSYVCEVVLRMHIRKKHKFSNAISSKSLLIPNETITSCTHRNMKKRNAKLFKFHLRERHSTVNPYHCPQCTKVYICGSIFLRHLRSQHHIPAKIESLEKYKQINSSTMKACDDDPLLLENDETLLKEKLGSKNSQNQQGKDYNHSKSVKTPRGHWKCLYCKQVFPTYILLRKHASKVHPTGQMVRCRWCDFVCRTNVQLVNHTRIHSAFIAKRMNVLRQICKNKRLCGIKTNSKKVYEDGENDSTNEGNVLNGEAQPINSDAMDTDEDDEVTAEAVLPSPCKQTARKSIQPCSRSEPRRKSSKDDSASTLEQSYKLTRYGTTTCKLCDFTTVDRSRMETHLKAMHVQKKLFKCKFCYFEDEIFENLQAHLKDHHKMERNPHLAVAVSVKYGADTGADANNSNNRSVRSRKRPFEPLPSLRVVRPDISQEDMRDIFDPHKKIRTMALDEESSSDAPRSSFLRSRANRTASLEKFECKYCEADSMSSFEMEQHMKRHEVAMVDATKIDEAAFLFSNFTSFLDPRV